jgi:hypothetical protein
MSDFMSTYFGPLDKSSCVYFLFLSVIFFGILVFALIAEIYFTITNFRQLSFRIVSHGLLLLLNFWLAYFVNRLMYTMCIKSLA